jgi:hypothetical protein
MTPEEITRHFTRADGSYLFARWERPIAPVVFGVEEPTLRVVKGACEAVVSFAGHKMAETDPELGANLMVFFFREWRELPAVPGLDRLIPDLAPLVERLEASGACQYRAFRFERGGAIKAAFSFLKMEGALAELPAETLALGEMAQCVLLWSDTVFSERSPLAVTNGKTILRPDIAGLIRAGYDPVLPAATDDPAHALRLYARMAANG